MGNHTCFVEVEQMRSFVAILLWYLITSIYLGSNYTYAVQAGHNGSGQVLIFPFFTAHNGWDTYIDLTLNGGGSTAPPMLKIYIREGVNGDIVRAFNVYTGRNPNADDGSWNWRASISSDDDNQTMLRIAEGPCTISDELIGGSAGTEFSVDSKLGTIEVYAMTSNFRRSDIALELFDCENAIKRWQPQGIWRNNPRNGLGPNHVEYRISGDATIINVEDGISVNYQAMALQDFASEIPHTAPYAIGDLYNETPTLRDADPIAVLSGGSEIIPNSNEGIDAVALVIDDLKTFQALTNQVITAPEIGAQTDWILTYPLTGYDIQDRQFTVEIDGQERFCESFGLQPGDNSADDPPGDAAHPLVEMNLEAAEKALSSWGNGEFEGYLLDLAPTPMVNVEAVLCNAVNVVAFGEQPSIFLDNDSSNLYRLGNNQLASPSSSTIRWRGAGSVMAFGVTTFKNGKLNGGSTVANYGILRQHR